MNSVFTLPTERFGTSQNVTKRLWSSRNVPEPTNVLQNVLRTLAYIDYLLDPKPVAFSERQQGFAELWVDGRFIKYIDLR